MARRARRENEIESILKLVGLLLLVVLLTPDGRQFLSAIGSIMLFLVIAACVLFVGFVIYWLLMRHKRGQGVMEVESGPLQPPQSVETSMNPVSTQASLIEQLRSVDWFQFEKIIAIAYRESGFHVTRRGGANPDGGIDLVISDSTGERTAIQSKQWKTWNVGVKVVREFLGAITDAKIQKGIFITLRGYTGEAKKLADKHGIQLLNETDVTALLEQSGARFNPEILDLLHDKRKLCPKCEREMVLRTQKSGPNPGSQFWGCSAYPRCHYTLPMAKTCSIRKIPPQAATGKTTTFSFICRS